AGDLGRVTRNHVPGSGPGGSHRGRSMSSGTIVPMTDHPIVSFPPHLLAPGTDGRPFEAVLDLDALPPGAMRRVTRGELDLLLVHTQEGIVVTDDRCPHMSAPLSIGELDGCVGAGPPPAGRVR